MIFGWLFGFSLALLQVSVALTTAAVGSFLLSRYFFRDAVQSRFGFYVTRFDKALCRSGAGYVIALRLLHVPYTFVNYTMGATSISWSTFLWATFVGMLPSNIVFVLAGSQLPSLTAISREGVHAVFSPTLMAAFLLMACFPFVVQRIVRSWRRLRGADTEDLTS